MFLKLFYCKTAVFCIKTAVLCLKTAVFCLKTAVFCHKTAVFCLKTAVFCLKTAVFCLFCPIRFGENQMHIQLQTTAAVKRGDFTAFLLCSAQNICAAF